MRNILYIKLQTYPQPLNAIYIFVLQILLSRYLSIIKVTPHYSNYCLFNYFFHPLFLHERSISLEKNLFHSFKQKRSYCGLDVKCNVYLAYKISTFLLIAILTITLKKCRVEIISYLCTFNIINILQISKIISKLFQTQWCVHEQ